MLFFKGVTVASFCLTFLILPRALKIQPFFVGKVMKLSTKAEEVATFFAKMLDHEYTTKEIFRKNFFKDWRKVCG